jgi:hypothetical protein
VKATTYRNLINVCGFTGDRLIHLQRGYIAFAWRQRQGREQEVEMEEGEEGGDCAVCLSQAAFGQAWHIPHCGHVFHADCLQRCFQNGESGAVGIKCPTCRVDITVQCSYAMG